MTVNLVYRKTQPPFPAFAARQRSDLLGACRKNGLEMRALFFPRDDRHLDVLEPGRFEKLVQLHFAEAEPVIGVKLAGPLEAVAEEIQNYDPSALS